MKTKILLLFLALFQLSAFAQTTTNTTNSGAAKIQFETEVMDYGTIVWNSDPKREFKFKNTGKEPLIIKNAQSSCGCLVAHYPKEPIAPGKSGVITARYDTKRIGNFEKTITVQSNDAERANIVLKIKGKVLPLTPADSLKMGLSPK